MTNKNLIQNPEEFEHRGYAIYKTLDKILSKIGYESEIMNFKNYFLECINKNTPSHKRSIVQLINIDFDNNQQYIPNEDLEEYSQTKNNAKEWLKDMGYRKGILTPQEHRLILGTVPPEENKFPYMPTGLIKGHITLKEAKKARKLEKYFGGITIEHFYKFQGYDANLINGLCLEPLNKNGNTLRDPRPIYSSDLKPLSEKDYNKSNNFPFKRD